VQQLCSAYGKPLVSTSANLSGQPAITDKAELEQSLGAKLSAIMPGPLGGATQPSQIRDALSGNIVRS
jgi:tRNA A37 threonylcarbamoyladenosine synthetase subunit TsaC/SUA5/YrdC